MTSMITATVGSAIIGGISADKAASKNRKNSRNIANRQLEQNQQQYDQTREDYMPYTEAGQGALNNMNNAGEAFEQSPGYDFARNEGMRDIGNSFSGRGSGGNAMRALGEYTTGLAQQDFGNWWNRQQNMANMGANAVGGVASSGVSTMNANNYALGQHGQNMQNATNDRYSGINNSLQNGISNWQYARNNKPAGGPISEIPSSAWSARSPTPNAPRSRNDHVSDYGW